MKEKIIYILTTLLLLVASFAVATMCFVYYNTIRIKNVPAQYFKVNEIINEEYRIIATDQRNMVWLSKYNDDNTIYLAAVSGDEYLNSSLFKKITISLKDSYKDYLEIEIKYQREKKVL